MSLSDLLLVTIFSISIGLVWGYVIWGTHQAPITKNYFKIHLKKQPPPPNRQIKPALKSTIKPLPQTSLSVSGKELQKISDQIDQLI